MRTWLERVEPPGDEISLPERSGRIVLGRAVGSTVIFDDVRMARQHVELAWSDGFWRLRDLGSAGGTFVNSERIGDRRALFAGDMLQFGGTRLRFRTDEATEEPATFEALERDPTDEMHWRVYADELQERGDPLGERIARSMANQRVDHMPWLRGLWEPFVSGELEIEWKYGFVQRAVLRTIAGRMPLNWRAAATQLINLRVARFVRSVTIDLPRLTSSRLDAAPNIEHVQVAQQFLINLPSLPPTLEKLNLGYEITEHGGTEVAVSPALGLLLPKLRETPVFHRANGMKLRVLNVEKGARLNGIEESRVLTRGTRIRRGEKGVLFIEATPGIPLMAEGNPCYFGMNNAGVQLTAGRMRGEVRVNQRIDPTYELLPGDVIDVQGSARFRVELVP